MMLFQLYLTASTAFDGTHTLSTAIIALHIIDIAALRSALQILSRDRAYEAGDSSVLGDANRAEHEPGMSLGTSISEILR